MENLVREFVCFDCNSLLWLIIVSIWYQVQIFIHICSWFPVVFAPSIIGNDILKCTISRPLWKPISIPIFSHPSILKVRQSKEFNYFVILGFLRNNNGWNKWWSQYIQYILILKNNIHVLLYDFLHFKNVLLLKYIDFNKLVWKHLYDLQNS